MDLNQEKELIKSAQKNQEVFVEIYNQYYHQIFGYILKRTANLEVAQDITSETFLKALNKLWQFRWRNTPFSSWLYKIATNEINRYFRNGKYKSISLEILQEQGFRPIDPNNPESEIIAAQEELQKHQDFLTCQKKISQLDIKYQEVLTLRFFEQKKIKEISQILNKSEGTIKSLLHRGLKKLQEQMQPFTEMNIINSERSK